MAGQEFQYIQDILKEFYAPAIVNQVYKKAPLWAQIKKTSKGVYGKRVVIPVQMAFTEAVGSRTANDYSLPDAQRNSYDQAYIYMKRLYGRIKVDGFAIESAKGAGGWTDIVTAESRGVADAFAIEVDRQSMGNGSAVLGHVASVAAPNIVVDNPAGITGDTPEEKWFRKNMVIDVYDVADGTKHVDGLTISTINTSTHTLGMSGSTGIAACADGDLIVRNKAYVYNAPANIGDMMGIEGIISADDHPLAADFQGIDRTVNEEWQAYVKTTLGDLTEMKIQEGLDSVEKRTDGSAPNIALTTYAIRNKLISLITSDRLVSTMNLNAGWKAIKYTGGNIELPIMVHKNCPTGYFYFISIPHVKFYTLRELVWDNKGGGILKPVANEDAYESWFKLYGQIGSDCPNSMGKLTGITV